MSEPDNPTDEQDRTDAHDPTTGEREPAAADATPDADDDARARLEAQLQRTLADLANLRKRMHKEIDEARRRAVEGLATEILPVLDNFHLALGVKDQQEAGTGSFDPEFVVEGMRMVKSLLESVLERYGLAEIRAEGCAFDPNLHEAVGVDSEAEAEPGQVTQVMQRGYKIGDKVLRASRVLVRGEPADSDASERES